MIEIKVENEYSKLEKVVLGIADDFGPLPKINDCYDPKTRLNVINNSHPVENELTNNLDSFINILKKYDVEVLRPQNINSTNQIFARDIAFAINDKLILPNIINERKSEQLGIVKIISQIDIENIIRLDEEIFIEGGDIVLNNNDVFIGYSNNADFNKYKVSRTNIKAVKFIEEKFPSKNIHSFELKKDDFNAYKNTLHLDCCFQPLGRNHLLIHENSFKNISDLSLLFELFSAEKIIKITDEEMYDLNCNLFSISDDVIVSDIGFTRVNNILKNRGFTVEEINFSKISKLGGLFRCSTLPLKRK